MTLFHGSLSTAPNDLSTMTTNWNDKRDDEYQNWKDREIQFQYEISITTHVGMLLVAGYFLSILYFLLNGLVDIVL